MFPGSVNYHFTDSEQIFFNGHGRRMQRKQAATGTVHRGFPQRASPPNEVRSTPAALAESSTIHREDEATQPLSGESCEMSGDDSQDLVDEELDFRDHCRRMFAKFGVAETKLLWSLEYQRQVVFDSKKEKNEKPDSKKRRMK